MPLPNRFLSSFIINLKGRKILVDCGEGTQVSMRERKTGFKSIDIICISHIHGDHIYGLPGLFSTIGNSGREEDIYLIGPKGIKEVIEGFLITLPYLPYKIEIIENVENLNFKVIKDKLELVKEDNVSIDLNIKTLYLDHSSPCLGYAFYIKRGREFLLEKALSNKVPKEIWSKLQRGFEVSFKGVTYNSSMVLGEKEREGIKISFTTDTRPTEEIPHFINKSDLYICEGTYGGDESIEKAIKNKHMTFKEAATLAKKGEIKSLILTHFSPSIEEKEEYLERAKTVFFNSEVAFCGKEIKLKFKE